MNFSPCLAHQWHSVLALEMCLLEPTPQPLSGHWVEPKSAGVALVECCTLAHQSEKPPLGDPEAPLALLGTECRCLREDIGKWIWT